MIERSVGLEISKLYRKMNQLLEDGTWNERTFRDLISEAKAALPAGRHIPDVLYQRAKPEWLELDEVTVGGPTTLLGGAR